jgi:hypothetical protein
MRLPRGPDSGPSIRSQPLRRTCQFQLMTVPSPSAAKVSVPEVSIIELAVRGSEPVRAVELGQLDEHLHARFPMRARNRAPSPMGGRVSSSTPVMAGLNDGSFRESATASKTRPTGAALRI